MLGLKSLLMLITVLMSIFVIDNHPLMREAIGVLIRRLSQSTPVIEVDRIDAVAQAVQQHGDPTLICLELKLPDAQGVSGIREHKRLYPKVPMVVLTASSASDYHDLSLKRVPMLSLKNQLAPPKLAMCCACF